MAVLRNPPPPPSKLRTLLLYIQHLFLLAAKFLFKIRKCTVVFLFRGGEEGGGGGNLNLWGSFAFSRKGACVYVFLRSYVRRRGGAEGGFVAGEGKFCS